jgi:serine/threonine protein kinase
MSSVSPSVGPDFYEIATRLALLSAEELQQLRAESESMETSPTQVALRQGLLTAEEIDTIETLRQPMSVVPGYEVLDVLGKGGMGVVYRARQLNLGRIVALKTVLVGRMGDASVLARFEQEARTLAQLRHPNIVTVYDFGRHAGRLYFAMEFIAGTDVERLVAERGALDEATAWGLARQVAAGLSHAARQGVVHRDVKPANVLLVDPPEGFPLPPGLPLVKIADFGLVLLTETSKTKTRLTSDNATVGSPQYMAPEQFEGSTVDPRADIHALGLTVEYMLTGRVPFAGKNLSQIVGEKLGGGGPALRDLQPGLSAATYDLAATMTARRPSDRVGDYTQLIAKIDALLPVVQATGVLLPVNLARPSGSATDILPQAETRDALPATEVHLATTSGPANARRRQWWTAGIVAFFVVAAAIGAWRQRSRPQAPPAAPQRVAMVEAGWRQLLFDGESMRDWRTVSGRWGVPVGEPVIEGQDGAIARTLFKREAGEVLPLRYYRLVAFVELRDAQSAELHFGFAPVEGRNGLRYVVRIFGTQVELGERGGDDAPFHGIEPAHPLSGEAGAQHVFLAERLPTGWFVTVDDVSLKALPLHHEFELPEFRLAAQGSAAWFSDIEVAELRVGQ